MEGLPFETPELPVAPLRKLLGCDRTFEVDLVPLGGVGEAHSDQQVADALDRRSVQELDGGEVGLAEVFCDPDRQPVLLLGEVGDDLTEVPVISDPVLVLDDDRYLVAVAIDAAGEDVEALLVHRHLGVHHGQFGQPTAEASRSMFSASHGVKSVASPGRTSLARSHVIDVIAGQTMRAPLTG